MGSLLDVLISCSALKVNICHFSPFYWGKDYAGDVNEENGLISRYCKVAKFQNKVPSK
jgi:hypothetical protein